jgi:hypothetical protein
VRMLTTLLAPSAGDARVMGFDLYKDKHAGPSVWRCRRRASTRCPRAGSCSCCRDS